MLRGLFAAALVSSGLAAQTFLVDWNNGPGTNYTSLPAAVAAVPDGAVLIVRPGIYSGFTVQQKGLTIIGQLGVSVTSQMRFENTAPNQSIALRRFHTGLPAGSTPGIVFSACLGPILLERMANSPYCNQVPVCNPPLSATACPQLLLRYCFFRGDISILAGSEATFENCSLIGYPHPQVNTPTPALRLESSRVQLARCHLNGGEGGQPFLFGPWNESAIEVTTYADLRVLDSTITSGTTNLVGGYGIAVTGQATLRVDPASIVNGVRGPTSGVTPQVMAMPHVLAADVLPGAPLTASTTTEFGDLVVLAVGFRHTPTTAPGITDAFWFGPSSHVVHAIGVQQPGSPVTGSILHPNAPGFVGLQLLWHAVCYGPVTGLQNTNPAVSLIR